MCTTNMQYWPEVARCLRQQKVFAVFVFVVTSDSVFLGWIFGISFGIYYIFVLTICYIANLYYKYVILHICATNILFCIFALQIFNFAYFYYKYAILHICTTNMQYWPEVARCLRQQKVFAVFVFVVTSDSVFVWVDFWDLVRHILHICTTFSSINLSG